MLRCPKCDGKDLRASMTKNLQYCRKCGFSWKLHPNKKDVANIISIKDLYE